MKKIFVLFPLVLMLAACGKEPKNNDAGSNQKAQEVAPGVAKVEITFKGIPLGKPNANLKSDLIKLCVESEKLDVLKKSEKECAEDFKSGSMYFPANFGKLHWAARAYVPINDQGGVDWIEISKVETSSILETIPLLEEKYGKPEGYTESVQNRLGTQFEQKYFAWTDAQGNMLRIYSIDKEIDKGLVEFLSASEVAKRIAENQKNEAAAKSNL